MKMIMQSRTEDRNRRQLLQIIGAGGIGSIAGCNGISNSDGSEHSNSQEGENQIQVTHLFLNYVLDRSSGTIDALVAVRFRSELNSGQKSEFYKYISNQYDKIDQDNNISLRFNLSESPDTKIEEYDGPDNYQFAPQIPEANECRSEGEKTNSNQSGSVGPFPDGTQFSSDDSKLLETFEIKQAGVLSDSQTVVETKKLELPEFVGEPDFSLVRMPDGYIYENSQWLRGAKAIVGSESYDKRHLKEGNIGIQSESRKEIPSLTHSLSGLLSAARMVNLSKIYQTIPILFQSQILYESNSEFQEQIDSAAWAVTDKTLNDLFTVATAPGTSIVGPSAVSIAHDAAAALGSLSNTAVSSNNSNKKEVYRNYITALNGLHGQWAQTRSIVLDEIIGGPNERSEMDKLVGALLTETDALTLLSENDSVVDIEHALTTWDRSSSKQAECLTKFSRGLNQDNIQPLNDASQEKKCFYLDLYSMIGKTYESIHRLQHLTSELRTGVDKQEILPGSTDHWARRISGAVIQSDEIGEVSDESWRKDYADANFNYTYYISDGGEEYLTHVTNAGGTIAIPLDSDGVPTTERSETYSSVVPYRSSNIITSIGSDHAIDPYGSTYRLEGGLPGRETISLDPYDSTVHQTLFEGSIFAYSDGGHEEELFEVYDADSGKLRWEAVIEYSDRNGFIETPRNSGPPKISDDKIYLDVIGDHLLVLDRSSGDIRNVAASTGGYLEVLPTGLYSRDRRTDAITSLDESGSVEWTYGKDVLRPDVRMKGDGEYVYAVSSDYKYLIALDKDGTVAWDCPLTGFSSEEFVKSVSGELVIPDGDWPVSEVAVLVPTTTEEGGKVLGISNQGEIELQISTDEDVVGIQSSRNYLYVVTTGDSVGAVITYFFGD